MQEVDNDFIRKSFTTCPDRKCPDNLFGYCQSKPDLDESGKCKKIGVKHENRNQSR